MRKQEYRTSELAGVAVCEARKPGKRIGKVRRFVFHPRQRRVIGFTVKRPDVALMAHRSDLFVALDAFDVVDGRVQIADVPRATGAGACKRLGVSWGECVLWQGMPLLTEEGQRCGFVGSVRFRTEDGSVLSVSVDRGASAGLLLGVAEVPAEKVLGFKTGIGDALNADEGEDFLRGGIVVAPDALSLAATAEGGLAERAGAASAKAAHKVSEATAGVRAKAKPLADDLSHKTGDAVNKGAFAVGRQLSQTRGMFASFKEEYRRASAGEKKSKE